MSEDRHKFCFVLYQGWLMLWWVTVVHTAHMWLVDAHSVPDVVISACKWFIVSLSHCWVLYCRLCIDHLHLALYSAPGDTLWPHVCTAWPILLPVYHCLVYISYNVELLMAGFGKKTFFFSKGQPGGFYWVISCIVFLQGFFMWMAVC